MIKGCRDSQRSKFYAWLYRNCKDSTLLRAYETREEINKQLQKRGLNFTCGFLQKAKRPTVQRGRILLPANQYEFLKHDIAILIGFAECFEQRDALLEGWHGPTFCKAFAEVYGELTGTDVQHLIDRMRNDKLKVRGYTIVNKRLTAKMLKSENRVQELEAAIQRGREEFEEFLQPILKELEKEKNSLNDLKNRAEST